MGQTKTNGKIGEKELRKLLEGHKIIQHHQKISSIG